MLLITRFFTGGDSALTTAYSKNKDVFVNILSNLRSIDINYLSSTCTLLSYIRRTKMSKEEVIESLLDCGSVSCRMWLNISLEDMMILVGGQDLDYVVDVTLRHNISSRISHLPNLSDRIRATLTLYYGESDILRSMLPMLIPAILTDGINSIIIILTYIFISSMWIMIRRSLLDLVQ